MPLPARLLAAAGRRPPRRRLLVALAALAAARRPRAAAPGDPLALSGPADGAQLTAGAEPGLQARSVAGDGGLELRVSPRRSRSTPACASTPRSPRPPARRPRTTRRCTASRPGAGTPPRDLLLAGHPHRRGRIVRRDPDPAARPGLGGPLAARPRGPVDRAHPGLIGASNGASFVIRTGGIPAGVTRALPRARPQRGAALAPALARHAARPSGFGNGRSEVGFSTAQVPRQALAVTVVGRPRADGRRERDLILRADLPWEQGPDHPSRAPRRPRDRPPARVRPCRRQPVPRAARVPRHPDGRRIGDRRMVAFDYRLLVSRLQQAAG